MKKIMIEIKPVHITLEPLSVEQVYRACSNPVCGAIDLFIGTVRNQTKGKDVVRLEFEAYEPMALKEMEKIRQEVFEKWPAKRVLIHHRVGTLFHEDIAVIIGVATPHRKASFEACEYAIDRLKVTVPIWKKEIFQDGEVWVAAHP